MRGKQGTKPPDPTDPPRRRVNRRRGHGTDEHDRPPMVGTVGRTSGQVRLRVVQRTSRAILVAHVTRCTGAQAVVCTDDWRGDAQLAGCITPLTTATGCGHAMQMVMEHARCT
ncbi:MULTISPECIES: transposase [Chloroflexus]|uniref:transposase n=1 Tax=Chloroflexus TaxID=1107 RepID=UPI00138A34BA|nr:MULTISPECIES: transposase [Chloroflexus]